MKAHDYIKLAQAIKESTSKDMRYMSPGTSRECRKCQYQTTNNAYGKNKKGCTLTTAEQFKAFCKNYHK